MRTVAGLVALMCLGGCLTADADKDDALGRRVETPEVGPEVQELAARVDEIGHDLVSMNPFLGVTPVFQVVGKPSLEIYHPDLNGVFVSQGLLEGCDDAEIAALLASELAAMSAEVRAARRLRPDAPLAPPPGGGVASPGGHVDLAAATGQALLDAPKPGAKRDKPPDAKAILGNAHLDPQALDRVAERLTKARQTSDTAATLGHRPKSPQWSN